MSSKCLRSGIIRRRIKRSSGYRSESNSKLCTNSQRHCGGKKSRYDVGEFLRKTLGENLKQMKSFAYLGNEKITSEHFVFDPAASTFYRYKMPLADKTVYYNFQMNKD